MNNGGKIGAVLYEIEENFDFVNPSKHLPKLMEAYKMIQKLEDRHWFVIKEKQIKEIIEACAGLYLEASADSHSGIPNATTNVNFEVLNRSTVSIELTSITSTIDAKTITKELELETNKKVNFKETITLKTTEYSDPYW